MSATHPSPTSAPLRLHAVLAEDVMTPNPVSIREELTVHEAVVFLTERRISAAPVINEAGRPVGVVSEADILRHDREHADHLYWLPQKEVDRELTLGSAGSTWAAVVRGGGAGRDAGQGHHEPGRLCGPADDPDHGGGQPAR